VARLDLRPHWDWDRLNFWSQIAFAFGGLELGALMSEEIRSPERTVPRAAWLSGAVITSFYLAGTLAILGLLRPGEVDVVNGVVQAGGAAGAELGVPWLAAVIGVLIAAGSLGQLGAWAGGSSRLPAVMGVDRYLPRAFGRIHPRFGTPYVSLIFQGVVCSIFLVATQWGESLRTGYQLLVDVCVVSYFIPFAYLFLAAWRRVRQKAALAGLAVTALGVFFSFVPPGEGGGSAVRFELKLTLGTLGLVAAGRWFFQRARARATTSSVPPSEGAGPALSHAGAPAG
jgi:amino acid transporter